MKFLKLFFLFSFQMENPWNIQSINEIQFYVCPSCSYKDHSKQKLIDHAYKIHPDSVNFLRKINDNSFCDVSCPWNETFITKIEIDETDSQELIEEPLQNEIIPDITYEAFDTIVDPEEETYNNPVSNENQIPFQAKNDEIPFVEIHNEGLEALKNLVKPEEEPEHYDMYDTPESNENQILFQAKNDEIPFVEIHKNDTSISKNDDDKISKFNLKKLSVSLVKFSPNFCGKCEKHFCNKNALQNHTEFAHLIVVCWDLSKVFLCGWSVPSQLPCYFQH